MSLQVNFNTHGADLNAAYQAVLSDSDSTDWLIYSYDKGTNDLRVQGTGDGGLEELYDEFSDGKIQFAYARVTDPNTELPKYVFIAWCGSGVPETRKGFFNSHLSDVSKFFKSFHVQINARDEADVEPDLIVKRVAESSGSKYSVHQEKARAQPAVKPVGSVYQKTEIPDIAAMQRASMKKEGPPKPVGTNYEPVQTAPKPLASRWSGSQNQDSGAAAVRAERERAEREMREREEQAAHERTQQERNADAERQQQQEAAEAQRRAAAEEAARREREEAERQRQEQVAAQARAQAEAEAEAQVEEERQRRVAEEQELQRQCQEAEQQERQHQRHLAEEQERQRQAAEERERQRREAEEHDRQRREAEEHDRQRREAEEHERQRREAEERERQRKEAEEEQRRRKEAEDAKRREEELLVQQAALNTHHHEPLESTTNHEQEASGFSAVVLFGYEAAESNEMTLIEGETILQIDQVDEGWWFGVSADGKKQGLFPANYVQVLEEEEEEPVQHHEPVPVAPPPPPMPAAPQPAAAPKQDLGQTAVALYDYTAGEDNEITFKENELITHIEFVSDDWWQGVGPDGKTVGLFPANYVDLQQ
ncbi:hypothetical protein DFQ28_004776 [Apophysomyces sp. BC1034]|nr:hypothetical protein DFQ30_000339 [Apophysomyces sp. BC1015]KAG0178202.1 hypothetical protein DFQ29_003798 [Apophysomyces sp. BC1021]KAG0188486.1 hypothetical protein DFQ28_004776 [Apophysomyces sp. BC1034]